MKRLVDSIINIPLMYILYLGIIFLKKIKKNRLINNWTAFRLHLHSFSKFMYPQINSQTKFHRLKTAFIVSLPRPFFAKIDGWSIPTLSVFWFHILQWAKFSQKNHKHIWGPLIKDNTWTDHYNPNSKY